jgi:hypothetical protein
LKLERWALVAEIVSGVAVVATLIFLIIEIRGNSDAIRADMQITVSGRTITLITDAISNSALIEAMSREAQGEDLSFSQEYLLSQSFGLRMKLAEESFLIFRDGNLDEEVWITRAELALSVLANERNRRRWMDRRGSGWYVQDFVDYVDSELAERYGQ